MMESQTIHDKISVAMAVYQGESYLKEQLDSILVQLRNYDEIVVSYDKSTDRTLEILQAYAAKDSRIKIIMNRNPGVTRNFNNAIEHCTGDYIYISDQDDQWLSGKVEIVQRCFEEKKPDLVIHNGIHTDADLNPIGESFFKIYRIGNGKIRNIIKPRYSGCCMAFTKEMQQIILPMPEIRGYDQWIATVCEFWGHIEYPEQVLLLHRLHGNNVTTSRRPLPVIIRMRSRLIINLIRRWLREKGREK